MRSRALSGLLLRPSLAATMGIIAALTAVLIWMRQAIDDPGAAGRVFFPIVFNALACGLLVSLGGFLGKVTAELETIRLARTVPGVRRWINFHLLLLVPIIALLALLFLRLALPAHFEAIHPGTQWCVNVFLFALGLGLGGYPWFLYGVLGLIFINLGYLLEHLRDDPARASLIALLGAGVLLGLRHRMFLAPFSGERGPGSLARRLWLATPFADVSAGRRTPTSGREAGDWDGPAAGITLAKLVQAGVYERLGQKRGRDWGRVGLSLALVYACFGILLFAASRQYPGLGFGGFLSRVFTGDKPDQTMAVMRHLFAALTGGMAYICAVTHDSSLRAILWHPVSRSFRFRAVFFSHLRQNVIYAGAHLLVAALVVAGLARPAGVAMSIALLQPFLLPTLIAFALAPVPQAIFPNGADDFHGKVNPLKQLLAGILGGLFCLLSIYWTAHWPTTELQAGLPGFPRLALAVGGAIAVYAGYYARMRHYYLHTDLSRRSA